MSSTSVLLERGVDVLVVLCVPVGQLHPLLLPGRARLGTVLYPLRLQARRHPVHHVNESISRLIPGRPSLLELQPGKVTTDSLSTKRYPRNRT